MAKANCRFSGTGGQYFATVLIHLFLLSLITLGLYSPWAWVRIFRLKASHTRINGKPVTFTGTGGQLFLLILVQGFITLITFGLYGPWAICKFFSWRAQNTLVDGTPSRFEGTGGGLFLFYLIHLLILPLLTLGLYYFYGFFRFYAWKEEHMRYGGERTSFGAGFGGFLKVVIITYILNILTLSLFTPWALAMFFRWQVNGLAVGPEPEVEHFAPARTSVVAVAALIVIPWAAIIYLVYPMMSQYKGAMRQFQKMTGTQRETVRQQKTYKVPKPSPPVSKKPAVEPAQKKVEAPSPPPPKEVSAPEKAFEYDAEMRKLNNLINLGSKNADAFYNRGWLYSYTGNPQMSEKDYTQAIELNKQYADAYYNRGLAYVKMEKYEQAISDFTQAIELDPRALDAYCNRGNANYQLGRMDLALRDLNAALRINPNDGDVYYNRAVVYLGKKQNSKATADFQKAANLGHSEAKKYLQMGPKKR